MVPRAVVAVHSRQLSIKKAIIITTIQQAFLAEMKSHIAKANSSRPRSPCPSQSAILRIPRATRPVTPDPWRGYIGREKTEIRAENEGWGGEGGGEGKDERGGKGERGRETRESERARGRGEMDRHLTSCLTMSISTAGLLLQRSTIL